MVQRVVDRHVAREDGQPVVAHHVKARMLCVRQVADIARIGRRLNRALQRANQTIHGHARVEQAIGEFLAQLRPARRAAQHQVQQLAGACKESPVIGRSARVDAQVFKQSIGAEGEYKFGTPALVAASLEGRGPQQLDGLGEVVELGEHLAQVVHILVAHLGRVLRKVFFPHLPLVVVRDVLVADRLDVGVVEEQAAQADLMLWLVLDLVVGTRLQGLIQVRTENAQKFQHRQVGQLLVIEAVPPDVLVDSEVDLVNRWPHASTLTVTGRENPWPFCSISINFSVRAPSPNPASSSSSAPR